MFPHRHRCFHHPMTSTTARFLPIPIQACSRLRRQQLSAPQHLAPPSPVEAPTPSTDSVAPGVPEARHSSEDFQQSTLASNSEGMVLMSPEGEQFHSTIPYSNPTSAPYGSTKRGFLPRLGGKIRGLFTRQPSAEYHYEEIPYQNEMPNGVPYETSWYSETPHLNGTESEVLAQSSSAMASRNSYHPRTRYVSHSSVPGALEYSLASNTHTGQEATLDKWPYSPQSDVSTK